MVKTIDARFEKGVIKPAKPLRLKEGQSLRVTIEVRRVQRKAVNGIAASAGAWADQFQDWDAFERELHARRHRPRKPVRL